MHVDLKKIGRILDGGWRIHGKGESASQVSIGRRSADHGSRLAYTEAFDDEKAVIAVEFLTRARAWFTAHGIPAEEFLCARA